MSRKGFTLLETLLALVILSLVVTSSFQLFGSALRSAQAARDWSAVTAFAEEGMEMAKLDLAGALDRGTEALEGGFERIVRAQTVAGGITRVTVSISFPGGGIFQVDRLMSVP
jgi:prepilin-type N-terminal cleavage/methylation domain-containing protein